MFAAFHVFNLLINAATIINIISSTIYPGKHYIHSLQYSLLQLIFVSQVSLTLGCPMDLALFPLDTQTCHLTIASYGWAANDLVYMWKVHRSVLFPYPRYFSDRSSIDFCLFVPKVHTFVWYYFVLTAKLTD